MGVSSRCSRHRSSAGPLVIDLDPGQTPALLLEVADFDQSGPELDGALDRAHYVIHDAHEVLLKKVRLVAVERLLKVRCEKAEGILALRPGGPLGRSERPAVHR